MGDGRPELIAINHDDYHAEHVGRTADGRQFFLTRPVGTLRLPISVHLIVAGMALCSTALPIWMTNEGIRRIGAGRVAMIGTSGPILTIGMSAVVLDEPVTVYQIFGAVLVIAGVALVTFVKKSAPTGD